MYGNTIVDINDTQCLTMTLLMLTNSGRDQMAEFSQTTFWNAFSSMKIYWFPLKFHWNVFPRVQLTIFHQWFRWWLGAVQATSNYLNQWRFGHWRIYASFGPIELMIYNAGENNNVYVNDTWHLSVMGNLSPYVWFMDKGHMSRCTTVNLAEYQGPLSLAYLPLDLINDVSPWIQGLVT